MTSSKPGVRLIALLVIALVALGGVAFAPSASAASNGTLTIHARLCPTGPLTDLFTDCHGTPAPAGQTFRADDGAKKVINGAGNASLGALSTGTHRVVLTNGDQPNEFLVLRAFCSDSNVGGPAWEVSVRPTQHASFYVDVRSGQAVVCDVYWIPESAA